MERTCFKIIFVLSIVFVINIFCFFLHVKETMTRNEKLALHQKKSIERVDSIISNLSKTVMDLTTIKFAQSLASSMTKTLHFRFRKESKIFSKNKIGKDLSVLCVSLISVNNDSIQLLRRNMVHSSSFCKWAVVEYKNSLPSSVKMNEYLKSSGTNIVMHKKAKIKYFEKMVSPETATFIASSNQRLGILPKPLLLTFLKPILREYDYIWIVDDDISLLSTDLVLLRHIFLWSMKNNKLPLLTQTLVRNVNLQPKTYSLLDAATWSSAKIHQQCMIETSFVEIQSPLIDRVFLEYLLSDLITPFFDIILVLEADYGLDNIWCGLAEAYKKELNRSVACSVVCARSTVVEHLDLKLGGSGMNSSSRALRELNNHVLLKLFLKQFPAWFIFGDFFRLDNSISVDLVGTPENVFCREHLLRS